MRIAISQRVDAHPTRSERRDALDQAWGPLLREWFGGDVEFYPIPNQPEMAVSILRQTAPALLILSGGNDIGQCPERDASERAMLEHAAGVQMPVLGVCRGLQMLQHYLGGPLCRVDDHVARAHTVHAVADGLPQTLEVNSYHNWGIAAEELEPSLRPLYRHADGSIEAAEHDSLPWLGIMWHPERAMLGDPGSIQWIRDQLQKVMR